MQIVVPAGVSMDVEVEFLSADPTTQNTAFAICSASVQVGSQLSGVNVSTAQPEFVPSVDMPDFNSRALLDFGVVTAAGGSSDTDRSIQLQFTAALIENSPYVKDSTNYTVTAGATYDYGNYIWIGDSEFVSVVSDSWVSCDSQI